MVFESIVADILNKALGDYVVNLDKSQLKLGIWGGDVVLKNLVIKESALDDLNLPVKCVSGLVGELVLKIPWKNLYSSPVIATIKDVYVLIVPNQAVKYDKEKEEQAEYEAKQKLLQQIEEAKLKTENVETQPKDGGFVEKLSFQIIKNVQVTIQNIHIRYEDSYSHHGRPFSIGITLENLSLETTNEHFIPKIMEGEVKFVYKLVSLDNLCLYWLSGCETYQDLSGNALWAKLRADIAVRGKAHPYKNNYVMGPITSKAKLKLNPKPEKDGTHFKTPKIQLSICMESLSLGLGRYQYQDCLLLLDSMERMNLAMPYRKFKPDVSKYRGHSKVWWKYAYTCLVEKDIRRRKRNFSWKHMKSHVFLRKEYKKAYVKKLGKKKLTEQETAVLEQGERTLDVLNITLARKQAENEAKREEKQAEQKSWLSGWWWNSRSSGNTQEKTDIAKQFEAAMTDEEKARLYSAIGYEEGKPVEVYPVEFVENHIDFVMHALTITVRDEDRSASRRALLEFRLSDVKADIQQRPSAAAIKVVSAIGNLEVYGIDEESKSGLIVYKDVSNGIPLLDVLFETNPLNQNCDQKVKILARPLELVYNAKPINNLIDVFKPPKAVELKRLQVATIMKLEDLREFSATGLQHAINQRKILDLDIQVMSSYIVIPEAGRLRENCCVVVINLGSISISTKMQKRDIPTVHSMVKAGSTDDQVLDAMRLYSYDTFNINITDIQILVSLGGEDWIPARMEEKTSLHVMPSLSIIVQLDKCLVQDDPKLPKIKVNVSMPKFRLNVSDVRLYQLIHILLSIPLPETSKPDTAPVTASQDVKVGGATDIRSAMKLATQASTESMGETQQMTDFILGFKIDEVTILLLNENAMRVQSRFLDFCLAGLELSVTSKTLEMGVSLNLHDLGLRHWNGKTTLDILSSTMEDNKSLNLLEVAYLQVNPRSPEFATTHSSTKDKVTVLFRELDAKLHLEVLLEVIRVITELQSEIEAVKGAKSETDVLPVLLPTTVQKTTTGKKRVEEVEGIELAATFKVVALNVDLSASKRSICDVNISGLNAELTKQKLKLHVGILLHQISVTDPSPNVLYKEIVSVKDRDAFSFTLTNFTGATDDAGYLDMSSVDTDISGSFGRMHVVFLNKFVTDILDFINNFQTARDAVVQASVKAADLARQNVEEVLAKASRVRLNFNIKAPVIYIPRNSQSYETLIADLGHLKLWNTFERTDVTNELGIPAILDHLNLELNQLKLSRIELTEKFDFSCCGECLILEPITFTLNVTRNLAASWHKKIPEMDISGKLAAIQITVSHEDYSSIMHTLKENLGETDENRIITPPYQVEEPAPKVQVEVSEMKAESTKHSPGEKLQHLVSKKMKFWFCLERIKILLYKGSSNLTGNTGLIPRDANQALARVALEFVCLNGEQLSNGVLWTNVVLRSCTLEDTRPKSQQQTNGITKLFEKNEVPLNAEPVVKSGSVSPNFDHNSREASKLHKNSMIDFIFELDCGGAMFVDLKLLGFSLVLSVDYLLTISDFFTSGLPVTDVKEVPTVPATGAAVAATASLENSSSKSMTVKFNVDESSIALVETMSSIDTDALILNIKVEVNLRGQGQVQNLQCSVKDLQMYSCCYNPAKRQGTTAQVLTPTEVCLTLNKTETCIRVGCSVREIYIRVLPSTIDMLSKVSTSFVASSQSDMDQNALKKKKKDLSNLWDPNVLSKHEFWYLKPEEGRDAFDELEVTNKSTGTEEALLDLPSISITMEVGRENRTTPLLLLESSFNARAENWSSSLHVTSNLSLEMAYHNSRLGHWEPIIEPVLVDGARGLHSPWEFTCEVNQNNETDIVDGECLSTPVEVVDYSSLLPEYSISLNSVDALELTVTKTTLEVITTLAEEFTAAVKMSEGSKTETPNAPYIIKNDLGLPVMIALEEKDGLQVQKPEGGFAASIREIILEPNTKVLLGYTSNADNRKTVLRQQNTQEDRRITLQMDNLDNPIRLPITKTVSRFYTLPRPPDMKEGLHWGLISDITSQHGYKTITLRSILQVHNHFSVSVDVYYMKKSGNELALVGTVTSGETLNVPLEAVHTPTAEVFFSVEGYTVSVIPFIWRELMKNPMHSQLLQCNSKGNKGHNFYINAVGALEQALYEDTRRSTLPSTCYHIHLRPTVLLQNLLPVPLHYILPRFKDVPSPEDMQVITLDAGSTRELPSVQLGCKPIIFKLQGYLEREWVCEKAVEFIEGVSVYTFQSYEGSSATTLDLGMLSSNHHGSMVLQLYSPFWMINKTSKLLTYREGASLFGKDKKGKSSNDDIGSVVYHPPEREAPVLFSFKPKSFFAKKKATLKVENSDWSDKFALDAVGNSGNVTCKDPSTVYRVGVQIKLSQSGLTKMVIFTPYFTVVNQTSYDLEIREVNSYQWLELKPHTCVPFWPNASKQDLIVRVKGFKQESRAFSYQEPYSILLKMDNQIGGIFVDCNVSESSVIVMLLEYEEGYAPVRLVNHTKDVSVKFRQHGFSRDHTNELLPQSTQLYAWETPSGHRKLEWECGSGSKLDDLVTCDIGTFKAYEGTIDIYWVSFLDGMQRVLLFTEDKVLASMAKMAGVMDRFKIEVLLELHGVGFSIVNNVNRREIIYMGIASSNVVWEGGKEKGKHYKAFPSQQSALLEQGYQRYMMQKEAGVNPQPRELLEGKFEVDWEASEMFKPQKKLIQRRFQPGAWVQFKSSKGQIQLHAKINKIQIDNQLPDSIFQTILAPVPPPKSVLADSVGKPFVEASLILRKAENSPVVQYEYFKVLVQEFHVKVDKGLIIALTAMFSPEQEITITKASAIERDESVVKEELKSLIAVASAQLQRNWFDHVHFSPMKIHISFSNTGEGDSQAGTAFHSNVMNVLLQSVGVTLTEIQDVVFKLAFFERRHQLMSNQQLISAAMWHYAGQAISQLYVLVLGLDVIGNPFGLMVGLTEGVGDLFYEPFQGAIKGPEEFAEGLALGVKSLLGHTVGGAAGAMERISATLGKGLAALTLDKEYQQKRRQNINRRPTKLSHGMAQNVKGVGMGVVEGVTGVFTKPIAGAKQEGVGGFFKGVGQGVVGLVTRPTSGVVDFASGTLDTVKRAAEMSDEVRRLRFPRFIRNDGVVRPYLNFEADGANLLMELDKGKFAKTDRYVFHAVVSPDRKKVILATDRRLLYLIKGDLLGQWTVEWQFMYNELPGPPTLTSRGIEILPSVEKRKKLGIFGGRSEGKVIPISHTEAAKIIIQKLEEAMKSSS